MSVALVPKGITDNKSVLVQAMALHQLGDKPLHKLIMTSWLDAVCYNELKVEKKCIICVSCNWTTINYD